MAGTSQGTFKIEPRDSQQQQYVNVGIIHKSQDDVDDQLQKIHYMYCTVEIHMTIAQHR